MIQISKGTTDKKYTLVQVMTQHQKDDKPNVTWIYDGLEYASIGLHELKGFNVFSVPQFQITLGSKDLQLIPK